MSAAEVSAPERMSGCRILINFRPKCLIRLIFVAHVESRSSFRAGNAESMSAAEAIAPEQMSGCRMLINFCQKCLIRLIIPGAKPSTLSLVSNSIQSELVECTALFTRCHLKACCLDELSESCPIMVLRVASYWDCANFFWTDSILLGEWQLG